MNWFHFHKWVTIKREVTDIEVTRLGGLFNTIHTKGIRILDKCNCGKYRAFLTDDNVYLYEKPPEVIFEDYFKEHNRNKRIIIYQVIYTRS